MEGGTFSTSGLIGSSLRHSDPDGVDRVAGEFPELKIVVSHAFWPWVTLGCGVAFRRPNVYLLPDVYRLTAPGSGQWVEAVDVYLSERLLFGSAYPLMDIGRMVDGYKARVDSEELQERILQQNAMTLLGKD
jgi:predicted TIM-barrel fold metal-dependent hydrolase